MPLRYCDEEIRLRSALRERRVRLGVRQADVARAMGWCKGAVSKYEQGEKMLDFIEVIRLCRILSMDAAALIRMCRGDGCDEAESMEEALGEAPLFRSVPVTEEEGRRLGAILALGRQKAGLTQAELARRTGMYRSCVSKYERGKRTLYFQEVLKISQVLGLDAAELARRFLPVGEEESRTAMYGEVGDGALAAAEAAADEAL